MWYYNLEQIKKSKEGRKLTARKVTRVSNSFPGNPRIGGIFIASAV